MSIPERVQRRAFRLSTHAGPRNQLEVHVRERESLQSSHPSQLPQTAKTDKRLRLPQSLLDIGMDPVVFSRREYDIELTQSRATFRENLDSAEARAEECD